MADFKRLYLSTYNTYKNVTPGLLAWSKCPLQLIGGGTNTITWVFPCDDPHSWLIQRRPLDADTWTNFRTVPGSDRLAQDLSEDQTFQYRVIGLDGNGAQITQPSNSVKTYPETQG